MGGKVRMTPRVLGKKNLGRLKVPDNYNVDKDEGYDGHLQWDGDSDKVLCMQWEFCEKISKFRETSNSSEVMMVFELLGVMGSEAQMEHMCNLLHDQTSAEPLKEALLTAICIGNRPLVELILSLFKDFPHEERSGCVDSEAYLPHITPLMLACILNNFAIVECLLLRGHSIDLPHHKTCK
uniref:ANK_REP_REGION domain-containing protein n=1 Tax=Heterorhabditis bacteriophora TaxID=37862 RepID=A0A1I7XN43_HETBA